MKPLRHLQWHVKVPYPFTLDLKSFNESEFLMSWGRSYQIWGSLKEILSMP